MRRLLIVSASVLLMVGLASPAAQAQRDPFEPAIESGAAAPGEQPAPGATTEPNVVAPPEPLADTGVEGAPWLALSYVLLALGLGILVLSRIAGTGPP